MKFGVPPKIAIRIVWGLNFTIVLVLTLISLFASDAQMQEIALSWFKVQIPADELPFSKKAIDDITLVFGILSLILLAIGFFVRKVVFSSKRVLAGGASKETALQKFYLGQVISCSCITTIGFLGLVFRFCNIALVPNLFFAVSLLGLFFLRPTRQEIP
jgi:hypothetical protein